MLPVRSCTAVCWREGSSWVVHVPELNRSATAARLSQVEGVARNLVTLFTSDDPASYRVVVDLRVRHSVTELVTAAAALREEPDRVSVEAVTLRRCLARQLAAEGFDVREVAALLGLSYGRALQLIGDHGHARGAGRLALPEPRGPLSRFIQEGPTEDHDADEEHEQRVKPHSSYRHEAFLFHGPDDFVARTVPFVEEAVALGQPVVVALLPERLEALRAELADDGPVYWVDMAELGANPARILPACSQFADEHGTDGRPVRGIGEPIWPGRRPEELVESQLHEALLNIAISPDTPLWLRCAYDVDALDPAVVQEASLSHPALVEADDYRGSRLYGGLEHVSDVFSRELPLPPDGVQELRFDQDGTGAVRHAVLDRARACGLPAERSNDLALGMTEAATNSVRHAGGTGVLRIWQQHGALVCEVRDEGRIADPLVGRRMPALEGEGGRGLWLVNQLCDLVQVRSTDEGVVVRVLTWLEPGSSDRPSELDLREAPVAFAR